MIKKIKKQLAQILKEAGASGGIHITKPPEPDMGDFAFPCFEYAQDVGDNPAKLAQKLSDNIDMEESGILDSVETAGPYLNFFLNTSKISEKIISAVEEQKQDFGSSNTGQSEHVLVEYPSPNTHKEFHVGHLRNICIGNVLVELFEKSGYEVSIVNYVNDLGIHVAKSIWGILNLYNGEIPNENTQEWLGKVYSEASQKIADDEELKEEVKNIRKKLTKKEESIWSIFEETRASSLEKFDEIYDELHVQHDSTYFESDIMNRGQDIVDDLLDQGIAEEGEGGAIIVDLEEYDLNTALVRKSNGEGLYITSDLALAEDKLNDFDVDSSINITANEQNLHFKQLFKILELYGFKQDLAHIGYGLVTLPEGKMSSREGNIVLYRELKNEIFSKLKQETEKRHSDWNQEQINEVAKKLTFAVLKFDLQKHEAKKNVTFDIEEATSFDGFSAPYILYVVARINSLLDKSEVKIGKVDDIDFSTLENQEEKQLVIKVSQLEEVIEKSLAEYNSSTIARYCFDLSQLFNDFYNKHRILDLENKEQVKARLHLCLATKQALKNALDILTIDTVKEM